MAVLLSVVTFLIYVHMYAFITIVTFYNGEPIITNSMSLPVCVFSFHLCCKFRYGGTSLAGPTLSYLSSFWRHAECIRRLKSGFGYVSLLWLWSDHSWFQRFSFRILKITLLSYTVSKIPFTSKIWWLCYLQEILIRKDNSGRGEVVGSRGRWINLEWKCVMA